MNELVVFPLAEVWAVLRPALAPLITAINWIHWCDNAATRSSKTTTSQPYVTGVDTETRSPTSRTPPRVAPKCAETVRQRNRAGITVAQFGGVGEQPDPPNVDER
jgi:hypothetical protein